MKEWTRNERYRNIQNRDIPELKALHEQISKSVWRTQYHVQPITGLMNDPNGFSFFNGKWHLFYQWFPFGAVHGMKNWYHVESEDLVHWTNKGLGLRPDCWYDNKGCYSGSGIVENDRLYITYTGNNRDENWVRHPYQMLAGMDAEGHVVKYDEPIIMPDHHYTEHQRDPKIFRREEDGMFYILLGVQNTEGQGKMVIYRSASITSGWKLLGELKVRGFDDFGYMVECPDIEKIGDKYVLLFSPQGIKEDGDRFRNKFNNTYLIGDLDFYHLEFVPEGELRELDEGFDFYAAQCAWQTKDPSKAYLSGWFGVADYTYPPTDEENWAGLQTLTRVLTIENGKLIQRPVSADSLKKDLIFEAKNGSVVTDRMHAEMPKAGIIEIDDPKNESVSLNLFTFGRDKGFEISYNKNTNKLTIDKSSMDNPTNAEFGDTRSVTLTEGLKKLQIFVDHSTVEIFVNDGEHVLSARIFPGRYENMIRMAGKDIDVRVYTAEKTVEDDFVL